MKKTLFNIGKGFAKLFAVAVLVTVIFSVLLAQYPSWQDIFVSIIHPQSGTGGVTIKNNASAPYVLLVKNSRGTTIFSVDSVGKPTGVGVALTGLSALDSATIAGELRQGGLVGYDQMYSIKNNAVNAWLVSYYNSRATKQFGVDSSGGVFGTTSLADTGAFSTTLATKAVYIPGAVGSDIYVVAKRNTLGVSTDTPTDSCILSYMAKTDSLIVMRQGTYAASGGSMPSGTKFSWIRIRRP